MTLETTAQGSKGAIATARHAVRGFVEKTAFVNFISVVIAVNAVTLGLETSGSVMAAAGGVLIVIDRIALAIFTVEIALKLFAYGPRFFTKGWNIFDFVIVAVALMPSAGAFSVLRALRILRALRLLSVVPQMRNVVGALLSAVPGMASIIAVLGLVFYVAAVMATKLFAADFPDWFGSVGASMYTLFQIMTLESWSMGIVRPVMDVHAWSWLFFVPFIIITSFAVLNLFIALIVNSLQTLSGEESREKAEEQAAAAHDERLELLEEVRSLRQEIEALRKTVSKP